MIDLYLLSVLAFFSLLAILIYRDRKNIDVKYFLLFMRRTKRFGKVLNGIASISPTFWKVFGTIGIVVCLGFMVYGSYSMINAAYLKYLGLLPGQAIQIALPIPSSQMTVGPGFIGIPFWFWIITIAIILIPHEALHGIIARAEKIRLKDVGLMLLAIFPGAFVEPDEKQLEKSKTMAKLRIFAAGSFINILIGIIVLILVQNLIWAPNVNGLLITSVNETAPAGLAGLKPGMVLQSINGKSLNVSFNDYSFLSLLLPGSNNQSVTSTLSGMILSSSLSKYAPGDNVTLNIDGSNYSLMLGEHPNIKGFAYIGIGTRLNVSDIGLFVIVFPLLGLMASLSILVGVFNILPIYPLDGGLVVKAIADRFFNKKNSSRIVMGITFVLLAFIAYTIIKGFF